MIPGNGELPMFGPERPPNFPEPREVQEREPADLKEKISQLRDVVSHFSDDVLHIALKHNHYDVSDALVLQLFDLPPEKLAQYQQEAAQLKKAVTE